MILFRVLSAGDSLQSSKCKLHMEAAFIAADCLRFCVQAAVQLLHATMAKQLTEWHDQHDKPCRALNKPLFDPSARQKMTCSVRHDNFSYQTLELILSRRVLLIVLSILLNIYSSHQYIITIDSQLSVPSNGSDRPYCQEGT